MRTARQEAHDALLVSHGGNGSFCNSVVCPVTDANDNLVHCRACDNVTALLDAARRDLATARSALAEALEELGDYCCQSCADKTVARFAVLTPATGEPT